MIDRIKNILASKRISAAKFADEIGVQRSAVSHIMSGRNKPSLDFMMKILERWPDISAEWLIRGKGGMSETKDLFSEVQDKGNIEKILDKKESVEQEQVKKQATPAISVKNTKPADEKEVSERMLFKVILLYSDNTYDEFVPGRSD